MGAQFSSSMGFEFNQLIDMVNFYYMYKIIFVENLLCNFCNDCFLYVQHKIYPIN